MSVLAEPRTLVVTISCRYEWDSDEEPTMGALLRAAGRDFVDQVQSGFCPGVRVDCLETGDTLFFDTEEE